MEQVRAEYLPMGSVVAEYVTAYVKVTTRQWKSTTGRTYPDARIDDVLRSGATILRVGTDS